MKIALVSLKSRWHDKEYNLARCAELAALAAKKKASMVLFPEMTLTGFSMESKKISENLTSSQTIQAFSKIAKRHGQTLVFGVVLKRGRSAENALAVVDPSGRLLNIYSKTHLFSFADEDSHYTPGKKVLFSKLGARRWQFSICYDLRFPEVFRSDESDVIVNIANWPSARIAHWQTLLKARAIENQAYVIGVNRTGRDANKLVYPKSSAVVDWNGDLLKPVSSGAQLDIYELDFKALDLGRRRFNTVKDKRRDLYSKWLR